MSTVTSKLYRLKRSPGLGTALPLPLPPPLSFCFSPLPLPLPLLLSPTNAGLTPRHITRTRAICDHPWDPPGISWPEAQNRFEPLRVVAQTTMAPDGGSVIGPTSANSSHPLVGVNHNNVVVVVVVWRALTLMLASTQYTGGQSN